MSTHHKHDDDIELTISPAPRASGAMDRPDIQMAPEVAKQIDSFARTDTSKELGGVLLGELVCDSVTPLVKISAAIEAKYTEAVQTSVKFTHESWDDINRVKDEKYPSLRIVGWFHTHPGFGIFLSRWDMFIQENFFNLPWQVAYVVDPVGKTNGFFRWEDGKVVKVEKQRTVLPAIEVTLPPEKVKRPLAWGTFLSVALNAILVAGVLYLGVFKAPAVKIVEKPVNVSVPAQVSDATEPAESWTEYIAKSGDSFWGIAESQYGDGKLYPAIQLFNNMPNREVLRSGQRLKVPSEEIARAMIERESRGN
ncbi:MAG: LysM peptidoglycan-binding domain-containing protein [Armatimonadetes bacterium]|nr:LysM peptidoglycan-binding domain-containing protein [Armatimonadota bacterium]